MEQLRVCGVIVTYHPEEAALEGLLRSLPSTLNVCIVNNGAREGFIDLLRTIPNIHIVDNGANVGLAHAQNQGIEFARRNGCSSVLFLDQDSFPTAEMLTELGRTLEALQASGSKVAAVGPRSVSSKTGAEIGLIDASRLFFRRVRCTQSHDGADHIPLSYLMSSGSLIPISVLDQIGGMDDSLFIDYVDTEWGLRAHAAGYASFLCCRTKMVHGLGESEIRIDSIGLTVYRRNPVRSYFMYRNLLLLWRRRYIPLRWKLNEGARAMARALLYISAGPARLEHLKKILLGVYHGLLNRTGPLGSVKP